MSKSSWGLRQVGPTGCKQGKPMIIGIPIYNGVDLLDGAAPYDIFNWMKEKAPDLRVEVYLLAEELNDVKPCTVSR